MGKFFGERDSRRRRTYRQADVAQRDQELEQRLVDRDSTAEQEQEISALTLLLMSGDLETQLDTTTQVRKLLSVETNPPIQDVIDSGMIPRLLEFLGQAERPTLQFEAAWVITNIASGTSDQTHAVVAAGALPLFVELLRSPNEEVREQAVWALGNIAGDSADLRDKVLESGALKIMLPLLSELDDPKMSALRNTTWALSNLCRGKPPPAIESVEDALPTLAKLLYCEDHETLSDACWAVSYISAGPNYRIAKVIESGVVPRMVELLEHATHTVQVPALRAVGNIVSGDDEQTQVALESGTLSRLRVLVSHPRRGIRKEALWAISNITAGSKEQIQKVIGHGLIPPVIEGLRDGSNTWEVRKEAAWAIANATSGGTPDQIQVLVDIGCLTAFLEALDSPDNRVARVALEGIENILKAGKTLGRQGRKNPFKELLVKAGGDAKLDQLSENSDKAIEIMKEFFGEDLELVDDLADGGPCCCVSIEVKVSWLWCRAA